MQSLKIKGLESYLVGETGAIIGKKCNKPLNSYTNSKGYKIYWLYFGKGERRVVLAHRAVALTYIENPEGKPQVNHKDGNKLNNSINNLEWCTDRENKEHAIDNGLVARNVNGNKNGNLQGTKIHTAKLTDEKVKQLLEEDSGMRLPNGKLPYGSKSWEKWGIGKTQYNNIIKGNYWKHVTQGADFSL